MSLARLTVIVATRDRAEHLDAMLASYAGEWERTQEFLVVDNGSRDQTPAVIERWKKRQPLITSISVAKPGQSLAHNRGIAATSGPYLAFLDDDVLVQPGWSAAMLDAFETSDCAGFQGRILLESSARADRAKADLVRRYNLLPITDLGLERRAVSELVGANMAVRRTWMERAGGFDEELGPGRSGFGGDSKLGQEIVARGGKLEYLPGACVEHVYDERRMTETQFEEHYRRCGRSRHALKKNKPVAGMIANVFASIVRSRWAQWRGAEDDYFRQRARYFIYSEMLRTHRLQRNRRSAGGPATREVREP